MKPLIELKSIHKIYQTGSYAFEALKGINLVIQENELIAIMGPSGSGKSTLMNLIGLLDHPTSGQYLLQEQETLSLTSDALACLRNRKIGFVFQSFLLLPKLTAEENVSLPLFYAGESRSVCRERAREILNKVEMLDYAHHKPAELSGGQQQRVAIARALVMNPSIILADEPTGALDTRTGQVVMEILESAVEAATVIIITHDPEVANRCQRVVNIRDGVIESC